MGFVLSPAEAQRLVDKDPKNKDVLFPYLNGEDLNSRPDQSPSRWVINFFDWPLDRDSAREDYDGQLAADYPDCLAIVEEKVKPDRLKNTFSKSAREKWWQYERARPELYRTIAGMDRVLVKSEVGNKLSFEFVPNNMVFSHMLVVFALTGDDSQAMLQSSLHESWAREYGSSMRMDLRYTPSDCFDTFPFPTAPQPRVAAIGKACHDHRRQIMLARKKA